MEREYFLIPSSEIEDFTDTIGWNIRNNYYKFIERNRAEGDGEWWCVIVQREHDGKYFCFYWGFENGEYYYEPYWKEVVKKIITKIIYE